MPADPEDRGAGRPRDREAERRRAEQRRRRLNLGGVTVAAVLVVALAVGLALAGRTPGASTDVDAPAAGETPYGLVVGPADAPHQVVVYEDFLCPFCGELEARTHERLAALASADQVRVDYRPFQLLGADYSTAALAAFRVVWVAEGEQVALAFHDALYADQPEESDPPEGEELTEDLVRRAVAAGADEAAVRPGIEQGTQADWAAAATAAAGAAGVTSTPTVLVDGVVLTAGDTVEERAAALLDAVG